MMELVSLLLVGLIIVISPGADFALVLNSSIRGGRRCGLWVALGIGCAISVHISYSLLGLGYLISQNEQLFAYLRYFGAAYLIYLGVSAVLTAKPLAVQSDGAYDGDAVRDWLKGFVCNALNPKTMLFFISLFSQLLGRDGSDALALAYGLYLALLHWLWFSILAWALTSAAMQRQLARVAVLLQRLAGVALCGFGVKLSLLS